MQLNIPRVPSFHLRIDFLVWFFAQVTNPFKLSSSTTKYNNKLVNWCSSHRQSKMGTGTGSTRTLSRRSHGQARLIRSSTENGDAAHTTLPSETRNDSNTTTTISSAALPGPSRGHLQRHSEIPPPKYNDLFPSAVSRRPAKPRPSPPKGMDPLVAAMWHNENLSFLHSLPDHLLLKVIGMLSKTSLECMRRVARRFPSLCVREVLNPLRGSNPQLSETGPLNWPRFGTTSHHRLRPQFLGLVDRDEYCGGCQAARKSSQWEQRLHELTKYIHCSACNADHPACLFSATQRLKPARLRYCIAHEGYIRICDHDDGTIRLPGLLNPERRPRNKRKHNRFTALRCRHPSHDKSCEKVPGGSFPKSKRDCGSKTGFCNGVRWPAIRRIENDPNIFDIYWTAHIPFNGQMDAVRSQIAEICHNAGKYIVPRAASATETPELRCFDPNDCHCITYSGTENVRWEWECGPWLPGPTKCISEPFGGLDTLQPTRPSRSVISDVVHRVVQTFRSRIAPECTAEPKSHRARDHAVPRKYGPGRCIVDVRPCHTGKDCLVVDYMRTLRVLEDGKVCPQWYNTLDPSSYNITDDQDGLGVFWCQQPHCRNYFKGYPNFAGILRHCEFRRECRLHSCQ